MTLALTLGMSIGYRRTLWMMIGELVGVALVSVSAVLGIAAIMLNYPWMFIALKFIGGGYLLYLGVEMWRSRGKLAINVDNLEKPKSGNVALIMHVFEASVWALVYLHVGALPDYQTAMLYSLNALTSYGHEAVLLTDDWRLLGAIESMNGVMIFGLTTAYLFNAMREFRPVRQRP